MVKTGWSDIQKCKTCILVTSFYLKDIFLRPIKEEDNSMKKRTRLVGQRMEDFQHHCTAHCIITGTYKKETSKNLLLLAFHIASGNRSWLGYPQRLATVHPYHPTVLSQFEIRTHAGDRADDSDVSE